MNRFLVGLGVSVLGLGCVAVGCAPREGEGFDTLDDALSAQDFDATVRHLTALPYLPWGYTPDGCYARASYYSMLLATKGVPTNHVYVLARPGTALGGIWRWHVAPLVTKDGDPNHLYVLDPVYNQTKALTNVEWVAHQNYPDPSVANYPSLHVYPGNSYLKQDVPVLPLVNPGEPTAANYKEPSFEAMPKFKMTDVAQACSTMHRYIDIEPNSTPENKKEKHTALGRETKVIVNALALQGKLVGEPSSLSPTCTRENAVTDGGAADSSATDGSVVVVDGGATDAGSSDPGVVGDEFVEPTRLSTTP